MAVCEKPGRAQDSHLLRVSQALLPFCLTERTTLWKPFWRFPSLRSLDGRGSCCFCLTFLLAGEMTCSHALHSLTKGFEHREAICRLRSSWNRFPGSGSVVSSAISAPQCNFWMGCHPGS